MDLLQSYKANMDEDEKGEQNPKPSTPPSSSDSSPTRISLPSKSSALTVDDTSLALTIADANRSLRKPINTSQHVVAYNPTFDQLWAPIYDLAHPYAKDGVAQGTQDHKLGFVEDAAIEPFLFDEQYST